jgi:hypothetical protein
MVDKENPFENKQREIREYSELTGFPDLEAISSKILEAAKINMTRAALKAGVNIKFSGYDQSCSVGRNLALPGSDLDGWYIVIDGDEVSKKVFHSELVQTLNPQVIDPDSISEVQIVLLSEVMQLGNESDFERHQRTQNVALATDILRNEWLIADNLSPEERVEILQLRLTEKNHFMEKDVHGDSIKFKLQKRIELSEQFQNLTQEEQYLILQIIQTINRGEDFDFRDNPENPNLDTLWGLCARNILNYHAESKKFSALWLTHAKLKGDVLKKFKMEF